MKYDGMPRPKAKAKEPSLDTGRDENRIKRARKTYAELMQQPEAFRRTLEYTDSVKGAFVSGLSGREIKRVVLIGCGDSWFVGTCLEVLVERLLGCPCQSYDAFEFSAFHCDTVSADTVIIGQSASGTTGSVLDSLGKARKQGAYTVGISNTEGAELLSSTDFGLLVQARREGWPTQATTSAIGAIAWLFASLCVEKRQNRSYAEEVLSSLRGIPAMMEAVISENEGRIASYAPVLNDVLFFQSAGCGPLYGASQVACAKLKELCPVHACSYPLEEFHHYRSLKPGDPLVLFLLGGHARQKEIDTALVGAYDGGIIIAVGSDIPEEMRKVSDLACLVPETLPELQPLVSMVAAHLLAYYVAESKYEAGIGYPSEA